MAKRGSVVEDTRPGHGTPADWGTIGRRFVRSDRHARVEVTEQDLGVRVRCHGCGLMARQDYRRPVIDGIGRLVYQQDPLSWALGRLDREPCDPLGQLTLGGA